ncbi:MAG: DNA recombination protein RmuC, partial [Gallionella sp.]|nr:DNA recombination protein RmuC [Gallionella sp.]
DGAVMFVPAEAVFAEIHAHHPDVVDYAMQRRVWVVSPTTLMAVLNTARAVMKDVETRKQVHIIQDELGKLGKDFGRFDERMKKLAEHIRQANKDVEDVQISSRKITEQFAKIERVELDHPVVLPQIGAE